MIFLLVVFLFLILISFFIGFFTCTEETRIEQVIREMNERADTRVEEFKREMDRIVKKGRNK
jgi:hypothetical protein